MNVKYKMIATLLAALFAFGLLFAGCGTVEWDTAQSAEPGGASSAAEPVSETLPHREDTSLEPVIEGVHVLIRPEASIAGGPAKLTDAFQAGDNLVLIWSGANGGALEAVDPATGESAYQLPIRGGAYAVEPAYDAPGEFRVANVDGIEYRNAANQEVNESRALPPPVQDAIWDGYSMGLPYDISRDSGQIAYMAADGIYTADGDGGNARMALDNALIPEWLGYWGLEGREYEPSRLRYAAPLLMNGGTHVAATAYLAGAEDGAYLGIAAAEVATGNVSYFPDPVGPGEGPAKRAGVDLLHARGEAGDILITPSTGAAELIPYDDSERYSRDYMRFARIEETEFDDGYLVHTLRWGQLSGGAEILKLGGYACAEVVTVTEGYVVLEAEEPAGKVSYLAVKCA